MCFYQFHPILASLNNKEETRMIKSVALFILLTFFFQSSNSVQINFIKVPSAVQNNTGRPVILDCNYSVRPDDTGLVVKWFLNEDIVYQWIPPKGPQSFGLLKDKIDVTFSISSNINEQFRALKILNPTTDIAGEYKCFVSTFNDEDFSKKNMIIFEPERALTLISYTPDKTKVNFTCLASEVYPRPRLYLNKEVPLENFRNPFDAIEWETVKHPEDGRYTTYTTFTAKLIDLNPGDLITCELRIPYTGYVKKTSYIFYPPDMSFQNGAKRGIEFKKMEIFLCLLFLIGLL